jgi:hypothetical protein
MEAALRAVLREAAATTERDAEAVMNSAAQRRLQDACERAAQEAASRSARGGQPGVSPADRIPEGLANQMLALAFTAPPATLRAYFGSMLLARSAAVLASLAPPAALPAALAPGALAATAVGQLESAWAMTRASSRDAMNVFLCTGWVWEQLNVFMRLLQGRNPLPAGALARLARPPAAVAVLHSAQYGPVDTDMRLRAFNALCVALDESRAAGGAGGGDDAGAGEAALEAAWGDDDVDDASRYLAAAMVALLLEAAEPRAAPAEELWRAAVGKACATARLACDLLPRLGLRLARAAGFPAALAGAVSGGAPRGTALGMHGTALGVALLWSLVRCLQQRPVEKQQQPEAVAACRTPQFVRAVLRLAALPPSGGDDDALCSGAAAGLR